MSSTPARAPAWAVIGAWALLAVTEVWLLLGGPGEPPWGWIAAEVVLCLGLGTLLWAGLPSFPSFALLLPAALALLTTFTAQTPPSGSLLYLLGAGVLVLGPLALLAKRRVPAVVGPLLAVLAVLGRVYAGISSGASGASTSDLQRFADALAWPMQRPALD